MAPRSRPVPPPPAAPAEVEAEAPASLATSDGVDLPPIQKLTTPANRTSKNSPPVRVDPARVGGRELAASLRAAGQDPAKRLSRGEASAAVQAMSDRPVPGHRRRGTSGDNHRVNPEHLRD